MLNCPNKDKYGGDLITKQVQYPNGPKQFVCQMVCYSSHVLNRKLIVRYSNGKKFVTEWHLVTELFTVVANQNVHTIQLVSI